MASGGQFFSALQVIPGSSWLSTLGFILPSISFKQLLRRVFCVLTAAILLWTCLHCRQQDNKTLRFASSVRIRFLLETMAHCPTIVLVHLEARHYLEISNGAHEFGRERQSASGRSKQLGAHSQRQRCVSSMHCSLSGSRSLRIWTASPKQPQVPLIVNRPSTRSCT